MSKQDGFRRIPSVDRMLSRIADNELLSRLPRERVVSAVRGAIDELRDSVREASEELLETLLPDEDEELASQIEDRIGERVAAQLESSLVPVLNATGVIIHTNLGRSPLGAKALEAVRVVASGYSNLEFDLHEGRRGSRHDHLTGLFCDLLGAESALVVNNNAASVVLILAALAQGGEVIVSRGELIEIGGSFRLPDIMEAGGVQLVAVGTTNRTRAADYEHAIGPDTRMLLKVHPSNYAIVGFTEAPVFRELVEVGRRHEVPVVEDLGSGSPMDLASYGVDEPISLRRPLDEGADLVCFSGDKLLGGPQCGVILGKTAFIERLRKHPLTRAFRVDKMTIAALEATVRSYVDGTWKDELPALRLLARDLDALRGQAERIVQSLEKADIPGLTTAIVEGRSKVGGGSVPTTELPSVRVALSVQDISEAALDQALREGGHPVVSLVSEGRVLWDVRTLEDEQVMVLVEALRDAVELLVAAQPTECREEEAP